jgi:hypothetical protein
MKRMIMAAVLLVSTVSVFAADVRKGEVKIDQRIERQKDQGKVPVCEVSLETSINFPGLSIKVTCTASSTSCRQAIELAKSCLEEAKKLIME